MTNALVILQPHSLTNPSGKYRLTRYDAWMAVINKESWEYPHHEYSTYAEADEARKGFVER